MQTLTSAGGHFQMVQTVTTHVFIGTYIPDFNSIPSAVLEKKFLENRPIKIFKVTWWLCFLTNLHKSNNSCVKPHRKHLCQVWF